MSNDNLLSTDALVEHMQHHLASSQEYRDISHGQPEMSLKDIKLTILMLQMALEKQVALNKKLIRRIDALETKKPWYHRFTK